MITYLNEIGKFVRWKDWGPGKIPIFCIGLFYAGLANRDVSLGFFFDFFVFIVFIMLQAALGYAVNDWGDREIDKLHGKENGFNGLGKGNGIVSLLALFILSCASVIPFISRPMVLFLWLALVFCLVAYSLKPLRLKEHGIWGIGAATIAQWPIPIMLTFAVSGRFGGWDVIAFVVAITIGGATLELAHQRYDRERDLSTQTNTLASRMKKEKIDKMFLVFVFSEKIALGFVISVITFGVGNILIKGREMALLLPLLIIYVFLLVGSIYETLKALKHGEILDPYYSSRRSISKLLHETLMNLVVPLYLMLIAAIQMPLNGLILLSFVIWRVLLGGADWRWPFRTLRAAFFEREVRNRERS